jgi:hypothetical protein
MKSPVYLQLFFIAITFFLAFFIFFGLRRALANSGYSPEKKKKIFTWSIAGFLIWAVYGLVISQTDFIHDFSQIPPRQLMLIVPVFVFIFFLGFSKTADRILQNVPEHWLLSIQVFRIPVEFFLWAAFMESIIPVQMTFEGRNFDIIAGITGPLIGMLLYYKKSDFTRKLAIVWNFAGIGLLMNIIVTALLSTPVFFRTFMNEPANTMIVYFPYIWLPMIVAPAALFFHVLSIRQLYLISSKKMSRATV